MARKVLLDTDILSEIFKGYNQIVRVNAKHYLEAFPQLSFTSVSAGELLYGLHAKDAKRQLLRAASFLRANEEIVPVSGDYWLAAEIDGALKRSGKPTSRGDTLIAASAINRGNLLVGGNTQHFQFIIQNGFPLELADWRVPSV